MITRKYKTIRTLARSAGVNQISLNDLNRGTIYHKSLGMIRFKIQDDKTAFDSLAAVVGLGGKSYRLRGVKPCGILERLVYDLRYDEFTYIAGQDGSSEKRLIRRICR